MSDPILRTRDATILGLLLLVGAVAGIWISMARTDCGLCLVNLTAAIAANAIAAVAVFVGMFGLLISMARTQSDNASTSIKGVLTVLVLGVIGAIVAIVLLADAAFVAGTSISGTVAGTAVAIVFLYIAVLVLLLDLQGVFSKGHRRAPTIPSTDEDQHVLLIEGIGTKYATRLNARGVITIPQLLLHAPSKIAAFANCTSQLAEEWQGEGRLMQVKGIGPQFAEILALAGLRTVHDLARADIDDLLAKVDAIEARRKTRVLKTDVKRHHIEKFVQEARQQVARKPPQE